MSVVGWQGPNLGPIYTDWSWSSRSLQGHQDPLAIAEWCHICCRLHCAQMTVQGHKPAEPSIAYWDTLVTPKNQNRLRCVNTVPYYKWCVCFNTYWFSRINFWNLFVLSSRNLSEDVVIRLGLYTYKVYVISCNFIFRPFIFTSANISRISSIMNKIGHLLQALTFSYIYNFNFLMHSDHYLSPYLFYYRFVYQVLCISCIYLFR